MAKITTITNPLTGQPVQVDQLDHTAQQIDDGLNIARNVSDPNLFDNWYFSNPINQRGQTSYTGENIYSIDRWKIYNATYNVDTGELISNGSYGQINQVTDKYEDIAGKTVTLSILFDSLDDGWSVRLHNDDKFVTIPTGDKLFTHTYVYPYDGATRSFSLCLISNVSGSKCKPIAVKLELGTQQTLAHQENGNWVLNEIPDYGEQLARCQRYYYRMRADNVYSVFGTGTYWSGNCMFVIPFPTTMRTVPVFSYSGSFILVGGPSTSAVSSITSDGQNRENSTNCACITVHPGASISVAPYILQANNDTSAYLEWTAEL